MVLIFLTIYLINTYSTESTGCGVSGLVDLIFFIVKNKQTVFYAKKHVFMFFTVFNISALAGMLL